MSWYICNEINIFMYLSFREMLSLIVSFIYLNMRCLEYFLYGCFNFCYINKGFFCEFMNKMKLKKKVGSDRSKVQEYGIKKGQLKNILFIKYFFRVLYFVSFEKLKV